MPSTLRPGPGSRSLQPAYMGVRSNATARASRQRSWYRAHGDVGAWWVILLYPSLPPLPLSSPLCIGSCLPNRRPVHILGPRMRIETSSRPADGPRGRLKAFAELTKPRIGLLLLAVAACSYYLGAGRSFEGSRFAILLIGVMLLAAGVLSLNQYFERERDGRMQRTRGRPLPSGRLRPHEALTFGLTSAMASVLLFSLAVNLTSAAVALFTLVSYILVYTPLKTRTAYHTTLGALSGGTPTLLGWAAARGSLEPQAWALFALLFFWQFPHFLAINLMYREDYARAGIRVLPGEDLHGGRTAAAIIAPTALLLAASLIVVPMGLVKPVYVAAAVPLGGVFFFVALRAALRQEKREGRLLLKASVLYLPCILVAMSLTLV